LDEGRPLRLEPVDVLDLVRAEASPLPAITVIGVGAVVSADRSLVARAVRNLLANASRHAVGAVRVSVAAGDGRVSVDVDDDGPGIDPNIDVFARFTRLDEARSTDSGGSGLGLAIVASVAAAHGGGVALERSALGGARVSIWFPATASVAEATL
jgi:signal transduction histidine kinase